MNRYQNRPLILLAEDDPDDQILLKRAVLICGMSPGIDVVDNGEDLLDYLNHRGMFESRDKHHLPSLILLDLNMPRMDGREALREIKATPELRSIPIVAFTTSNHAEDIDFCYQLGVNAYITKPNTFEELMKVVRVLSSFWFETARVPVLN